MLLRLLLKQTQRLPQHYCLYVAIIALLQIQSTVAASNEDIPLFEANYQADIKGFRVKASRELVKQADKQYTLLFTANSMIASLEESTTLNWDDNRLTPISYSYSRNVIGKKEERHIHFDHQRKSIESYYRGANQSIPYSPELLDSLAYQLQLQQDLRNGKSALNYPIISKGKTKINVFKRETEEVLNTELGQLRTVKISLEHNSDKRQTYIWFAVDWEYLLVRFEQYEKGKKEFVINLSDATIDNKRIKGLSQ